jgi:hypothetical protein
MGETLNSGDHTREKTNKFSSEFLRIKDSTGRTNTFQLQTNKEQPS